MYRLIGLFALAALLAVTIAALMPPAPGRFAAGAFETVKTIARAPHPIGSAEHDRVRDHLVAQLRGLGLETRIEEGVGVLPLSWDGMTPVGKTQNIVAVRPGTQPTGKVVLAAHYDSVAAAPGASDDGAGVATVLQIAKELPASTRNDVVFLLTDGEEEGLLGAEAYAKPGGTVVVLNHEARGVRGSVQMFRASPGSAPLISLYGAAAPHPSADSAFTSLMSLLPNNTDFHVFAERGWLGMDSAYVGGGAYYHSPLDDPAHLDRGSLQAMGDNSLAMARVLGDADLTTMKGGDSVYFTVPWLLIRYPAWLELPIALGGLVLAGVLVFALRQRGLVSLPRVAAATGLSLVPVVVAGAAGFGLWPLLGVLRPEYTTMFTGDPYRPWLYQAALLVFPAAIVLLWWLLTRKLGGAHPRAASLATAPSPATAPSAASAASSGLATLGAGGLLLVALLGVLLAVLLPGGSHSFAWSALFASLGWLVSLWLRGAGWQALALTLGLAPAAVLLGGTAITSLDVGLSVGGVLAAPFFALFLLLLLPLIPRPRGALVLIVAAAVLVVAGLVVDRFDADHPRQSRLVYAMDAATGEAVWGTPGQSQESKRFFDEDGWSVRPAQKAPLQAPELTVVKDDTSAGKRTITLRLTPTGKAPITGLSVEGQRATMTVAGRDLGARTGFAFNAPPKQGLEVTLVLRPGQAKILAFEQDHDLSVVPGFQPQPDTVQMGPRTTVFRRDTL